MSGMICFLRYLLMKITCAMRDAISTTRLMSRAGLRGRLGDIDGVRIGRLVQALPSCTPHDPSERLRLLAAVTLATPMLWTWPNWRCAASSSGPPKWP